MKKMRQGLFETNSSSSHSITLAGIVVHYGWKDMTEQKDNLKGEQDFNFDSSLVPDEKGKLCIEADIDFNQNVVRFSDAETKVVYCYVNMKNKEALISFLKRETGAKKVNILTNSEIEEEFEPHMYPDIDAIEDICRDTNKLRSFIFNKNSVVEIWRN